MKIFRERMHKVTFCEQWVRWCTREGGRKGNTYAFGGRGGDMGMLLGFVEIVMLTGYGWYNVVFWCGGFGSSSGIVGLISRTGSFLAGGHIYRTKSYTERKKYLSEQDTWVVALAYHWPPVTLTGGTSGRCWMTGIADAVAIENRRCWCLQNISYIHLSLCKKKIWRERAARDAVLVREVVLGLYTTAFQAEKQYV